MGRQRAWAARMWAQKGVMVSVLTWTGEGQAERAGWVSGPEERGDQGVRVTEAPGGRRGSGRQRRPRNGFKEKECR